MRFRSEKKTMGTTHSKTAQTYRESTKHNYSSEKKDLEHEYHTNEAVIMKAQNDRFEYGSTKLLNNAYVVEFFNRNSKNKKHITFQFEDNYVQLKHLWEDEIQ